MGNTKPYKCDCCKANIRVNKDYQPKFDKTIDVEVINPVFCTECDYIINGGNYNG